MDKQYFVKFKYWTDFLYSNSPQTLMPQAGWVMDNGQRQQHGGHFNWATGFVKMENGSQSASHCREVMGHNRWCHSNWKESSVWLWSTRITVECYWYEEIDIWIMMTSWHGYAFQIMAVCGDWWMMDSPEKGQAMLIFDVFFYGSLNKLLNKQLHCCWLEMPWCSCEVTSYDKWTDGWTEMEWEDNKWFW